MKIFCRYFTGRFLLYYRAGKEPSGTSRNQLIQAKRFYESSFHPDSGELMNVFGRMSCQVFRIIIFCFPWYDIILYYLFMELNPLIAGAWRNCAHWGNAHLVSVGVGCRILAVGEPELQRLRELHEPQCQVAHLTQVFVIM